MPATVAPTAPEARVRVRTRQKYLYPCYLRLRRVVRQFFFGGIFEQRSEVPLNCRGPSPTPISVASGPNKAKTHSRNEARVSLFCIRRYSLLHSSFYRRATMSERKGASSTATDTNFRRKWDKEEYAEKARQKDQEEKERMQENDERLKQGKRPRKGLKEDLPKPTELMKQRDYDLELDKNLNRTVVVQNPTGRGPGQPGFHCETCNRTYKDTTGYLDHINGRQHLRKLGQNTRISRSTVEQVRARIAFLREQKKEASSAKTFDFNKRLAEVKAKADAERAEKKAQKKAEKEKARMALVKDVAMQGDDDMTKMMGFGGFGSSKK
ncbi:hypothetical protein DFH11DRAFT_423517 [Phellopilus nigrolimitatus]|nr:hypothetical protein DFH11DRAFT_423517 [Phellopilus nigrolimitatus]